MAAALAESASHFSLGDALIRECGATPASGTGPDGSYAKLEAARRVLIQNGVSDYSAETLRKIRNAAFRFPPDRRRAVSFCMHVEAGSPDVLDEIIASLPHGVKLSVDFVQDFVRARRPRPVKERHVDPPSAARLVAPLVKALLLVSKAARIAAVHELLDAVGLDLTDLGAPALRAASPVRAARSAAAAA